MTRLTILAICCTSFAFSQGASEPAHAFIELGASRTRVFAGEPVTILVRVGYDETFFRQNAIQLFRQRLDLPIHVDATGLQALAGSEPAPEEAERSADQETITVGWNDGARAARRGADVTRDGRRYATIEVTRVIMTDRPGTLRIPPPQLRFAYATRFEDDLVNGRVPVDRHDVTVKSTPLDATVDPVPEGGRPTAFGGAVGSFRIHASASPVAVDVGQSVRLVLTIEGAGNLATFDAPRLDRLRGFHVYGVVDQKLPRARTFTFDLAPRSEAVREIPSIAFVCFDTTPPGTYRTLRTLAIPLEVRALPPGVPSRIPPSAEALTAVPGEDDIFDLLPVERRDVTAAALSPGTIVLPFAVPWIAALALASWLRRRERERRDPAGVRARRAARTFRRHAHAGAIEPGRAFVEYLAARLRCDEPAVIDPALPARFAQAGIPAEMASRASAAVVALVGARYGGPSSSGVRDSISALVEELEDTFVAEETPA